MKVKLKKGVYEISKGQTLNHKNEYELIVENELYSVITNGYSTFIVKNDFIIKQK